MKIWINAVSATAGGGLTYLRRLAAELSARPERFVVWVPSAIRDTLSTGIGNVEFRSSPAAEGGYWGRLLWEQRELPRLASNEGADVLLCIGNVAPLRSRVPVVVVSQNALYFSGRFQRELMKRLEISRLVKHWLKGKMVVASARAADAVVTPSQAMADLLAEATNGAVRPVVARFAPHRGTTALDRPPEKPTFDLLVVSAYNYFRNFETIFRAVAHLRKQRRPVRLLATTRIEKALKLGGYDTSRAHRMIQELGIAEAVVCLGTVPHQSISEVYAQADAVICAGYVESFSFSLPEAMAEGVPVVASDIPVHRELGGDAALYFSPLDPVELAERCAQLMDDRDLRQALAEQAVRQAARLNWDDHFSILFRTIEESVRSSGVPR